MISRYRIESFFFVSLLFSATQAQFFLYVLNLPTFFHSELCQRNLFPSKRILCRPEGIIVITNRTQAIGSNEH